MRVIAFTPKDAQFVAQALLRNSENLINDLNRRVYKDMVSLAETFLGDQQAQMRKVESDLTNFRNQQKLIDPNRKSAALMGGIATLTGKLAAAEVVLSQQIASAPNSPAIGAQRDMVKALRDQIAGERARIAGRTNSISNQLAKFDQLLLDRDLAARSLEAAVTHIIQARQDAEQQQYYLQTIAEPNLPDWPQYPRRLLSVLFAAIICFCVHRSLSTVLRSIMEHQS